MKKVWFFLLVITFLVVYWLRWNRHLSLSSGDIGNFGVPELKPVENNNNLGYNLQNSEMQEIDQLFLQHTENVSGIPVTDIFRLPSFLEAQKMFSDQLSGEGWISKSGNNSVFTWELSDFLTEFSVAILAEKIEKSWLLPPILETIQNQERYVQELRTFPELWKINQTPSTQNFGITLGILSLYYAELWERDKVFEYRKSSFLLGEKMSQNNQLTDTLIGTIIQENALKFLHILMINFELPNGFKNQLSSFLSSHPINAEKRYTAAMLNEYRWMQDGLRFFQAKQHNKKDFLDHLEAINGYWYTFWTTFVPLKKFFDFEETSAILDSIFASALEQQKVWSSLDPRCPFNEKSNTWLPTSLKKSPLLAMLWRKNAGGVAFLCSLFPKLDAKDLGFWKVEKYQEFLHAQL